MLIACQSCATTYTIDASSLGPAGRSVRCVRCLHVWYVANTDALAAPARAHRSDVAALVGLPGTAEAAAPAWSDATPESEADNAATGDMIPLEDAPAQLPSSDAEALDILPPTGTDIADVDVQAPADLPALAAAPAAVGEDGAASATIVEPDDIESVAARRARRQAARRRTRWPLSGHVTAGLLLVAVNVSLVVARAHVVRLLPQTASLYRTIGLPVNLRELVFTNVTSERDTDDGVPVLVVEGTIASTTGQTVEVPRLRFALRDESGLEIYAWSAPAGQDKLAAGETLSFRSRLASPPLEGTDLLVRFLNRHDIAAANR